MESLRMMGYASTWIDSLGWSSIPIILLSIPLVSVALTGAQQTLDFNADGATSSDLQIVDETQEQHSTTHEGPHTESRATDPIIVARILHDLDQAILMRLKQEETTEYLPKGTPPADEDVCGICREPFHDPVRSLCGRHIFCYNCITRWLARNPSCPTCRYNTNDLINDFYSWCQEDLAIFFSRLAALVATPDDDLTFLLTYLQHAWLVALKDVLNRRCSDVVDVDLDRHWAVDVVTVVLHYLAWWRIRPIAFASRMDHLRVLSAEHCLRKKAYEVGNQ